MLEIQWVQQKQNSTNKRCLNHLVQVLSPLYSQPSDTFWTRQKKTKNLFTAGLTTTGTGAGLTGGLTTTGTGLAAGLTTTGTCAAGLTNGTGAPIGGCAGARGSHWAALVCTRRFEANDGIGRSPKKNEFCKSSECGCVFNGLVLGWLFVCFFRANEGQLVTKKILGVGYFLSWIFDFWKEETNLDSKNIFLYIQLV